MKEVNIIPTGRKGDTQGMPSSYDMRQTPKNWGHRKVIGVIKDGVYIETDTGQPVDLSTKKAPEKVRVCEMGGTE